MKPTLLLSTLLLAGTTLHAQFSLQPYAGFEQSRNSLRYANTLSASDINGNLKAGLRMDYRLKGGHSPFINLTTNPAPVSFSFNKAGSLMENVAAIRGSQQLRLEAGYGFSSKPISFGKKSSSSQPSYQASEITSVQKSRCGSATYRSRCGAKQKSFKMPQPSQALNMRLQPSLAFAYIPSQVQTVKQTADGFNYTAGNWKTALVPAMSFEFAKGSHRLFTLTTFYTQPLRQNKEAVNTSVESKIITTDLQSAASTWGVTLGVPFSFTKAKARSLPTRTEKRGCNRTYYKRSIQL